MYTVESHLPELQLSGHTGYPIAFTKAALATFVDKELASKGNIMAVSTHCMAAENTGKLVQAR